jgi:hypothetical protein
MHAATIRRMIVFGVCTLGVGSLYLVPSIARSPEQTKLSGPTDEPTTSPTGPGPGKAQRSAATSSGREPVAAGGVPAGDKAPTIQPSATRSTSPDDVDMRPPRKPGRNHTKSSKDSDPPQPVADIEASKVTPRRLTVSWPATGDNVGVIGYRIWLNGFEVATTAETRARLRWFNNDSGQHVVQIRAVDAAGNQSRSSPTLVITRPSPEPTGTPTPEPSDSSPTRRPTEPSRPDAQFSKSPGATLTRQKSTAEPTPR